MYIFSKHVYLTCMNSIACGGLVGIKALASARGSEKKRRKKRISRNLKELASAFIVYMFFMTQSKKSNLRRGLNHVPIDQIV